MKNLEDFVMVYPFDVFLCKEIVEKYKDEEGWHQHSWYDNGKGPISPREEHELENYTIPENHIYSQLLKDYSVLAINKYQKDLGLNSVSITGLTAPRLNRYVVGANMAEHCDHIHSIFDGERKGIPILSILSTLNDGYSGGEFILCGENVVLPAGHMIVFPSNFLYPHEVRDVTSGVRYSAISWAW